MDKGTAKTKWELIPVLEQRLYIERAMFLIERGYVSGDPFEIARQMYYSDLRT
jgi:hypothetical protein